MTEVIIILGMIIVTWGIRITPFLVSNLNLSPNILRFLNCVPAAVLAALVAEPILTSVIEFDSIFTPEVIAAAICLFMGVLKAPMLAIVLVGMSSYWIMGWVFSLLLFK